MWENDEQFVEWLDENGYGTDYHPIDDDTLRLMYDAWCAGKKVADDEQGTCSAGS